MELLKERIMIDQDKLTEIVKLLAINGPIHAKSLEILSPEILENTELTELRKLANMHVPNTLFLLGFYIGKLYAETPSKINKENLPQTYPLDQVPIPEGWEQCGFREPKFDEYFLTETGDIGYQAGDIGYQDGAVSFKGREANHIIIRNEGEKNAPKHQKSD